MPRFGCVGFEFLLHVVVMTSGHSSTYYVTRLFGFIVGV